MESVYIILPTHDAMLVCLMFVRWGRLSMEIVYY